MRWRPRGVKFFMNAETVEEEVNVTSVYFAGEERLFRLCGEGQGSRFVKRPQVHPGPSTGQSDRKDVPALPGARKQEPFSLEVASQHLHQPFRLEIFRGSVNRNPLPFERRRGFTPMA
jgi:hypothetical protein